jgi:type II secretory pathway pseudopilin PulG
MRRRLMNRLRTLDREAGMTLIELLVAMIMGIIVVGGATEMLTSALRDQPKQQKQAESVDTARYELERMTRELRDGVSVDAASASSSSVSFVASLRRTSSCDGTIPTSPSAPAVQCQIVYSCTTSSCTRTERKVGVTTGGVTSTIVTGISSAEVFCFLPSSTGGTKCGPAKAGTSPDYVGITLAVPNPSGSGSLKISDGAGLRSATLTTQ